jgi:hypothetical protein
MISAKGVPTNMAQIRQVGKLCLTQEGAHNVKLQDNTRAEKRKRATNRGKELNTNHTMRNAQQRC